MGKFIPMVDEISESTLQSPVSIEGKKTICIDVGDSVLASLEKNLFKLQITKSSFVNQLGTCVKYINYFIKYFDEDSELMTAYLINLFQIKNADTQKSLTLELFLDYLEIYFGKDSIIQKFKKMVDHNMQDRKLEPPKNRTTESVQITNEHYNAIMLLSCLFKCIIPIISSFYNIRKDLMYLDDMPLSEKDFYFICFSRFIHFVDDIYDIDLYSKMYHTTTTRVAKTSKNKALWDRRKQFGTSEISQQSQLMKDLVVDLIQKALFDKNVINLIHVSFDRNINNTLYQKDKFDIISISSAKSSGDDDEPSKFDNLQMTWTKFSIEQKLRAEEMIESHIDSLCKQYDIKITDEMISFYKKRFSKNTKKKDDNYRPSTDIQINLIYLFFSKYTKSFTVNDFMKPKWFIKIIIIFKEIYTRLGYRMLPILVSGDIDKLDTKRFNKQQLKKRILEHPDYPQLKEEYCFCGDHINKDKAIDSLRDLVTNKVYVVDHRFPEETERREYIDISNNYATIANEIVRFLLDL